MIDNGEDSVCSPIPPLALSAMMKNYLSLGYRIMGGIKRWGKILSKGLGFFYISPEPDLPFLLFPICRTRTRIEKIPTTPPTETGDFFGSVVDTVPAGRVVTVFT